MVSGTGRTFAKCTHVLLCRCGGSGAKPFCDGTHARNGFTDADDAWPRESGVDVVSPPALADWAGGRERLRVLTEAFYRKVPDDPLLAPMFAQLAVINSGPGVQKPEGEWPMPQWGWCAAGPAGSQ
ncbi:CDGSH iron-sulfur domain-containing protein [Bradyrhizobium sp. HKCCYLS2038]|uniref:CDGSH iron-sulfur domain-containing protein n=1 Tax=unclassified Bradyrhizobium TaxID=2631580 RepID=UPI003EB7C20B